MSDTKYSSVHYNSYLQLEKLLDAQKLRSVEVGDPAHDEMLFIIIHQVYELWFKQINHELRSLIEMFNSDVINEKNIGTAVHRLDRVNSILELAVNQIALMETMTPLDFLDFRNYLFPASGFQSFQFREMEVMLGLKESRRTTYNNMKYRGVFDEKKQETLGQLEDGASLFELLEDWLERTPFLEFEGFNFLKHYKNAVTRMLEKERKAIQDTGVLSDEMKEMRLRMLGDTGTYFSNILDEKIHQQLLEEGKVRLSYKATVAVLLIFLYRDEPLLQQPFNLLTALIEVDDTLTTWRYRHAQMVMRMLGKKIGTGGSSGHEYLSETATKHKIFADLHNVSTLLIPRSELPELPEKIKKQLSFTYSNE